MLLSVVAVAVLLCVSSFEAQAQSDSGAGLVFKLPVTQVHVGRKFTILLLLLIQLSAGCVPRKGLYKLQLSALPFVGHTSAIPTQKISASVSRS